MHGQPPIRIYSDNLHKTYVKYLNFKLYYHTCVTWQVTNCRLPEDQTVVSKHLGVIICQLIVHLLVRVQGNLKKKMPTTVH